MRVIFTVNPKVKRCQSRAGYERFGFTAAGCNWVDGKPERMRARTTNSGRTNGAGRAVALATAAAVALTMSACDPAQPKNGDAPAASQTPTATQPSTATELPTAPASPPTSQPPAVTASPSQGGQPTGQQTAGKPGHVFVINLENKGYFKVWDGFLAKRKYAAGDEFTIADLSLYAGYWRTKGAFPELVSGMPNLERWGNEVGARPAIQRALKI